MKKLVVVALVICMLMVAVCADTEPREIKLKVNGGNGTTLIVLINVCKVEGTDPLQPVDVMRFVDSGNLIGFYQLKEEVTEVEFSTFSETFTIVVFTKDGQPVLFKQYGN